MSCGPSGYLRVAVDGLDSLEVLTRLETHHHAQEPYNLHTVTLSNRPGDALSSTTLTTTKEAPTPLRQYSGVAVQLPFYAPYAWIVSICVIGAMFGHIVVFRWLLI